ncbi:spermidine synthase [Thalassotalea sp. PLHSN55]|uniref:spermidine synthase n=1 Tax=Thalassotalea sp. PLHSN55 TaxID=3435888 RepID=UPI003F87E58F
MLPKIKWLVLAISFIGISSYAEIIHSERSLYRNIIVEDKGDLRCLKFNERSQKSHQSCMLKSQPDKLVFNYTKLLTSSLLLIDQPKSVLIIGLGGGTMSNMLHQLYPNARIDNVEIDPAVIKVAREYFGFFENQHINTYAKDGRIFVKRAKLKKQSYDLIILDAYNGDYIPEHLMTAEFLQESKSLLSEQGVLAANTFSISKLYAHESATYQSVFGYFYNVKKENNGNRIILAQKNYQTTPEILRQRTLNLADKLERYDVDIDELSQLLQSTQDQQDWPAHSKVLTDQFSPANLLNLD